MCTNTLKNHNYWFTESVWSHLWKSYPFCCCSCPPLSTDTQCEISKIDTVTYRSQSDMYFRPKNYFTKFQAFTMATYHGLKIKEFAFLKLNTIISIELSLIVFQWHNVDWQCNEGRKGCSRTGRTHRGGSKLAR